MRPMLAVAVAVASCLSGIGQAAPAKERITRDERGRARVAPLRPDASMDNPWPRDWIDE